MSFLIFQGGFAKCYEIVNVKTKEVFAGKIVSKKLMVKSNQKDKMAQEISIHRSLKHHHVVQFYSFFEDSMNIYIVLELCKRRVSIIGIFRMYVSFTHSFYCRIFL